MINHIANTLKKIYVNETLRDTVTYKIDIDGTISNDENLSIVNSIASTYKKPIRRFKEFNIKNQDFIKFQKNSLFVWDIIFKKNDINFYLTCDTFNESAIIDKAKTVWNKCRFSLSDLNDFTFKNNFKNFKETISTGELFLKTYNFQTLNVLINNQYPLTNMMCLSKMLKNDEFVRVTIAFEPTNRLNWISVANDEKKKFDNGIILNNEISMIDQIKNSGLKLTEEIFNLWLELKLLPINCILGLFLDSDIDFSDSKQHTKKLKDHEIHFISNDNIDFIDSSRHSNYKMTAQTFKTKISITSFSNDFNRNKINMLSCANAFKDLTYDNELVLKIHNDKEKEKLVDEINYFNFSIGNKCILSDKEICKLMQLPKKNLQMEYKMNVIENKEVEIPKQLQNGKIKLCTVEEPSKNTTTTVTLPEDINALCKKTVLIGGEGSGKTTQLIRLSKEFSKNHTCNLVIDHQENGKLTDYMMNEQNENDYIVYDVYNQMPALAFPEIAKLITEDMDKMLRLDYANMMSKQVELLINSITDDTTGNLTGRMKRFLHSACMSVFIKPNTTINDVFNVLNNWEKRNEAIRYVRYSNLFDEDDDIFIDLNELHKRTDKGKIIGTRDDLIVGITNRITILKQNPRIKEMLKKPYDITDDFDEYIQSGKSIYIKIPQNKFPDDDTRDMLATYYFSRLWLTVSIRNENKYSKPCHVIIDEIKSLPVLSNFIEKKLTEFRRHRISMTIACHSLNQFGKMLKQLMASGGNFIFLQPCEKESFNMMKDELQPFTYEEDMLKLKPWHGICLINYGNQYCKFVGKFTEK